MEYKIKRSSRKTLCLEITAEGLLVRAPLRASNADIASFVETKRDWIEKHLKKVQERESSAVKLTRKELEELAEQALKIIPQRVAYYAPQVGVTYGRITIRNQHTRWGSCSSKGNLNFNCLLMLTPPEVLDSVVVHELCHRKEMNHSAKFYEHVLRVYPDYHKWNKWLKDNGRALMARMV
ncbi:MAG: M48 family metallopeptidase [Ruminococcus sp.]|nr:M48 family metallopeptidase [Ruminococcus sp.]